MALNVDIDMDIRMTSSVDAIMQQVAKEVDRDIVEAISFRAAKVVEYARERAPNESWNDNSGNLRSSIGAKVTRNGNTTDTIGFVAINGATEGASEGRSLAEELASVYNEDYALIVGAGMDYAANVEATDGKDVLSSAELQTRAELPKDLAKLSRKQYFKGAK